MSGVALKMLSLAFVLTATVASGTPTNWNVHNTTDPMTDAKNGSAAIFDQYGNRLIFSCNGLTTPTLAVQFIPKAYLGASDNLVVLRFDSDPPLPSVLWNYVSKGAYTTEDEFVDWFSRQVGDGQRLIRVRALNYQDQPVDSQFLSVNGRAAINQIRTTCGKESI